MTDAVVAVFDEVADVYDEVIPFFATFAQATIDAVAPAAGDRVLDVGAGRGALAGAAASRGAIVTAVDAAPRMVALIRADGCARHAVVMDAHRLGFADRNFDLVLAGFVIHLVDDPAQAAREARRVLAAGERVAFTVPGAPQDATAPDALADLFDEFAPFLPAGGGMGRGLDAPALLETAEFVDAEQRNVRISVPVADAATVWRWLCSHGSVAFIRDLPPVRREQFHARVLQCFAGAGPIVLHRSATLWSSRTPG